MASSPATQAEALAARGRTPEALRLLDQAGRRGDGDALFTLAIWHLEGQRVPRDLAESRLLFGKAARAGRRDAATVHAAFVANGTGGPADWRRALAILAMLAPHDPAARDQLAILAALPIDDDGAPLDLPQAERLSASPNVVRLPGLFAAATCDFLVRAGEAMLVPAMVIDPRSGRFIRDPVRTSDTAAFPLALENPAIHALNRRIAAASGTLVTQGEPLQLLSYRPGQQYHPHVDALPGVDNQRVQTMLVYLNDGYGGGETRFLPDGPTVQGRKGDGLLFRNVDTAGRPDPASRHAGLPVTSGRKLIASRWIRARPLDLGDKPQRR